MGFVENTLGFAVYTVVPFFVAFIMLQPINQAIVDIAPAKNA